MKKKIPLYLQILIGLIVGVLSGMIAHQTGHGEFIKHWISPWGNIFIRLLQLIAVPLVFLSMVKGVTALKDIKRFTKIGLRTLLLYIFTTIFAIIVGLTFASVIKPGSFVRSEEVKDMQESYRLIVQQQQEAAEEAHNQGPLVFLNEVIPDNIILSMSDNRRILQVIFFAVLFSLAILALKKEQTESVVKIIDSLNDIILKIVDFIIIFAPYGVTALMAGLVIDFSGELSLFAALGIYAGTVITALLFLIFVFNPLLVKFFTRIPPGKFLRKIYPVQLMAFTTSSSAATLPFTLETAQKELKISKEVSSFVLPVGVTINMDGTSCFQAISVLFIAQVFGMDLTMIQLLTILLMTTLSSIGTPGIPGGSYVILTIVLSSVGIPAEGLALILGVDRPLDMLRTSVNVTGDITVSAIIDNQLNKN